MESREKVSGRLHPLVFDAMAGFAVWLVLSVWFFFAGNAYSRVVLVVVSGLALAAIVIPYVMWHISRQRKTGSSSGDEESFRDWRTAAFDTWQARLKGRDAAIEILLPLAAVAFGMTAIGLVLYFT